MKKIIAMLLGTLAVLTACSPKSKNTFFTGTIESVWENGIMVVTTDDVGFDKASVGYDKSLKLDFTPEVGQEVDLEILPEVRESYPVQVTAVKMSLKNNEPKAGVEAEVKAEYKKISPKEAKKIMDSEKDVIILDVRTQEEYAEGHIPNAILIPDTEIAALAAEKLPNKDAKILVYCRSGRRSKAASQKLVEMGYTNVLDFGGIADWKYDIVK